MNVNKQQGFTLIELVMVIVILGILAATALPKFIDMSSSARKSTLKGLEGAIQGAKSIVKAGYLLNPSSPVTMSDGTTVTVSTTTGLPTADAPGIRAAIDMSNDFTPDYTTVVGTATFTLQSGCSVSYVASTGAVSRADGGC